MSRVTYSGVSAIHAGCMDCDKQWNTRNALAIAARHHDATGHTTWCDQVIMTRYGEMRPEHSRHYGERPTV
jgi:hypothetical protein